MSDADAYEQRLKAWQQAEAEAVRAELAVPSGTQGAQDPRVMQLYADAKRLRDRADGMLAELVASVRDRHLRDTDGGSSPAR